MSHYFDHTPDLSNSIITPEILDNGRKFYRWLLKRLYGDSKFRPGKAFGRLWNQQQHAPGYGELTNIALVLSILYNKTGTDQHDLLNKKVKKFFAHHDAAQHEEDFNEFRMGAFLGTKLGRLDIEPLAGNGRPATAMRSPDYRCNSAHGPVMIDSTTLRVGPIQEWSDAVDHFQERLQRFLDSKNLWRRVRLKAPLHFRNNLVSKAHWQDMCRLIEQMPNGQIAIRKNPSEPIMQLEIEPITLESAGLKVSPGDGLGHFIAKVDHQLGMTWACQISQVPPIEITWLDLLETNLANVIKKKKLQFEGGGISVLGITVGFKVYNNEHLFASARNIFRPGKHSWLAGIVFLLPGTGTDASSKEDEQFAVWNPYAEHPAPEGIRQHFGTVEYHDVTPPSETSPAASS